MNTSRDLTEVQTYDLAAATVVDGVGDGQRRLGPFVCDEDDRSSAGIAAGCTSPRHTEPWQIVGFGGTIGGDDQARPASPRGMLLDVEQRADPAGYPAVHGGAAGDVGTRSGMSTAFVDRLMHAGLPRAVKNRVAAAACPQIYRMRARVPRLHPDERAKVFRRRALERGLGDVELYYWYHTVNLGEGLVTPGLHDYRRSLGAFHFRDDMSGMNVLDVGSATGFFAFEFERRGAHVVSVELPSLDEVDRFPYQEATQTVGKIAEMTAGHSAYTSEGFDEVFHRASPEDFYHYFMDGPFQLCHRALGSRVERRYASIYDIPRTDLGASEFDLIFLGDLLLHTMHPLNALAAVAPLCRGTLVISQHMPSGFGSRPAVLYVGGDQADFDHSTWWYPNLACFQQLLRKLGFRSVEIVGHNTGVSLPVGSYYDRPVLHATR